MWDLPEVYWYTADEDVRVIYAEREVLEKNYHIVKKKKKKKKRKPSTPSTPSTNKPLQNKDDLKKKGRQEKQKLSTKAVVSYKKILLKMNKSVDF